MSDIKRTSKSSLRQRLSSSCLLDGPVNSSMSYPASSTPNADRILDISREGLSSCVKQLMFDSESSYHPSMPSGVSISSSVSSVEPTCEETTFCSQEVPSTLDLKAPSSASLQPLYSSNELEESTLSLHQPSSDSLLPLYSFSSLLGPVTSEESSLSLHQPSSASMQPLYSSRSLQVQDSTSSQESTLSLHRPSSASMQPLYSSSLQQSTSSEQSSLDLRPPSTASLHALYSSSLLQGSACTQKASFASLPRPACEGCESSTGGLGYAGDLDDTRPDDLDLDATHYETAHSHLSHTVDSDASAFLDVPLCSGPVTGKHRPIKFRRVSRQLQRLSRQIHRKGSKALNLKTLAVL